MKNKVIYSFSILTLIVAMICSLLIVGNGHIVALAESNVSDIVMIGEHEYRNLHTTTIEDDLTGATLEGKAFNFDDYSVNPEGKVKFLSLVEFGYMATNSDYFELFVYVYNPTGNPISTISGTSSQNKMSICVDRDKFGEAKTYEKFVLSHVDHTDDNLFYKFSVVLEDDKLFNSLDSASRRYDIAEIELLSLGENAISSLIGYRYVFTGYQQGCDLSAKNGSTLQCIVTKDLEVLELDVHHTVYRTNSSDKGAYYKNQINSCYFAIPNEVYNQYENIDFIKAEWWEYYTKFAFVTNNQVVANSLLRGVKNDNSNTVNRDFYSLRYGYRYDSNFSEYVDAVIYDWGYNVLPDTETYFGGYQALRRFDSIENMIPMVFFDEDLNVDCDTVKKYIDSYSNELGNGYLDVNGRTISKDLFDLNYTADGFNQGYNLKEIKFGDTFDLISYDDNHSAWQRFLDYGFTQPLNEDSSLDLEYIKVVEDDDFSFDTISEDLLIGQGEAQTFYDFYRAHKNTHKVILLRFGVSDDYWAHNVEVFEYTNDDNYIDTNTIIQYVEEVSSYPAYIAKERVYLDFDILQINFMKDGDSIAIPVATNPQDSVGGYEPPEDENIDNTHENIKDDFDDLLNEIETWFDKLMQEIRDFFKEFWSVAKWVLIVIAGLLLIVGVVVLLSHLSPRRVKIKFKQPKQTKKSNKRKYVKPPMV